MEKINYSKNNRVLDADVCVIWSDKDQGFGNEIIGICTKAGFVLENSTSATPEQNVLVERAGWRLTAKYFAMRIHVNQPKYLANEIYKTAAYNFNRTSTGALKWKTPYEMVWGKNPHVSHMHPIWFRASVLNKNNQKGDKIESRALIGHIVGYKGTNIFKIWLPESDDECITRDVVFDNTLFFDEKEKYSHVFSIQNSVELLEYPD